MKNSSKIIITVKLGHLTPLMGLFAVCLFSQFVFLLARDYEKMETCKWLLIGWVNEIVPPFNSILRPPRLS